MRHAVDPEIDLEDNDHHELVDLVHLVRPNLPGPVLARYVAWDANLTERWWICCMAQRGRISRRR
jgi:hypothetical protein